MIPSPAGDPRQGQAGRRDIAKLSYAKLTPSVPKQSLKGSLVSCISWPQMSGFPRVRTSRLSYKTETSMSGHPLVKLLKRTHFQIHPSESLHLHHLPMCPLFQGREIQPTACMSTPEPLSSCYGKKSTHHSVMSDSFATPRTGARSPLSGESFPTQGSNLGLQHCRQILHQLGHQESPKTVALLH